MTTAPMYHSTTKAHGPSVLDNSNTGSAKENRCLLALRLSVLKLKSKIAVDIRCLRTLWDFGFLAVVVQKVSLLILVRKHQIAEPKPGAVSRQGPRPRARPCRAGAPEPRSPRGLTFAMSNQNTHM